jgi:site-specific DNA-methyltransferase (adenine-specific)
MIGYINGDCHDVIKTIPDNSQDFIYTDPPFGTTGAKWDSPLRWGEIFPEMWRVLKPNGIIAIYASMPFTYELLKYETPRYHYTWHKSNCKTNFLKAKLQPLRNTEEIFIYYKKPGTYNPQMEGNDKRIQVNKKHTAGHTYYGIRNNAKAGTVNPNECHYGSYPSTHRSWGILRDGSGITRTNEQIDFFIKTYTNENDKVLDLTCHSYHVGNRCRLLNRDYTGIDINLLFIPEG